MVQLAETFFAGLTVRENLVYGAELRMHSSHSLQSRRIFLSLQRRHPWLQTQTR